MKIVVYTANIGGYDTLNDPKVITEGVDYICFSDMDIKSSVWKIRKCLPLYEDNTRTARKYKVLPHRFLSEYDVSIWVDSNLLIIGNSIDFINKNLKSNLAIFDHINCYDKRNCIYQEAEAIFSLGKQNGKYKDDPNVISKQMNYYMSNGYIGNNGLVSSGIIIRKHNSSDVKECMENWWNQIKLFSKRDQLSFNYCAHQTKLKFDYINDDIRNNNFSVLIPHNK